MVICVFFGALLGGLNGVAWSVAVGFALISLTVTLGDKCLLFILGARELTQKEKKITSLVNNYGCLNLYKQIKIYSFHDSDLRVCYFRSFVGQGSLILSDSFLSHENAENILNEVISESNLNSSQFRDVAIMLSYQMMVLGYILSPLSKVLSSLVFYMFYPVVQMRSYVINEKLNIGSGQLVHVMNKERNIVKRKKIVVDITNDFSILDRSSDTLINYSLSWVKARANLG